MKVNAHKKDGSTEKISIGFRTIDGYIEGLGRDCPPPKRSHLYQGSYEEPGLGMCRYAYNRKEDGYSIWRNNRGELGICKICFRRAQLGLKGIENPYYNEK